MGDIFEKFRHYRNKRKGKEKSSTSSRKKNIRPDGEKNSIFSYVRALKNFLKKNHPFFLEKYKIPSVRKKEINLVKLLEAITAAPWRARRVHTAWLRKFERVGHTEKKIIEKLKEKKTSLTSPMMNEIFTS